MITHMSFEAYMKFRPESGIAVPEWLPEFLGTGTFEEGAVFELHGQAFVVQNGIPRSRKLISKGQAQTSETFGFKWKKRDTFDAQASLARLRNWLVERYGDIARAPWLAEHGEQPLLIDAGCGTGMSTNDMRE